jgi:hypothetical protein
VTYATGGSAQAGSGGNASANTGNGGLSRTANTGGFAGGSGVVIISAPQAAASTTGSPTVTTFGGRTIYQFNASGTITF